MLQKPTSVAFDQEWRSRPKIYIGKTCMMQRGYIVKLATLGNLKQRFNSTMCNRFNLTYRYLKKNPNWHFVHLVANSSCVTARKASLCCNVQLFFAEFLCCFSCLIYTTAACTVSDIPEKYWNMECQIVSGCSSLTCHSHTVQSEHQPGNM